MGRYYNGDINGKFWVGIQGSNDADFFGVTGEVPDILRYSFEEDDIPLIKEGIKTCLKELGEYKEKLDIFFEENELYNDIKLQQYLEIASEDKYEEVLKQYARLELGEKILKCVEENGCCYFEAEL